MSKRRRIFQVPHFYRRDGKWLVSYDPYCPEQINRAAGTHVLLLNNQEYSK